MMHIITLLILALAAEALTKLIRDAEIFDVPRAWICARSKWMNALLTCGYCISVWSAAIVLGLMAYFHALVLLLALHRLSNVLHDLLGIIVADKIARRMHRD